MKVPNDTREPEFFALSLSRLQNEGSQPGAEHINVMPKSIKATE